ncbi:MAG: hypothetical protein ACYDCF_03670 [Burkholderiales bacterium]|nr:hypothetical protein [Ferrovum sp.]
METMLMNPWVHIAVLVSFTTVVTVWDNAMWDRKALSGAWKMMPLFK